MPRPAPTAGQPTATRPAELPAAPGATSGAAPAAAPNPTVREIWANRQRRTKPAPRKRLDPSSWVGALVAIVGFTAVLWIVQLVNSALDDRLDRFGLQPRTAGGLWGVLAAPFLHADVQHMVSDTLPVICVGWVLLLAGLRVWLTVSVIVILAGGLLTWAVGPAGPVIVGANALVFGWLGFLIARAAFSRELKWIFVSIAVLFFFGTLLFQLSPTLNSHVTWQANACGLAAGVGAAALLHPRRGQTRFLGRPAVS